MNKMYVDIYVDSDFNITLLGMDAFAKSEDNKIPARSIAVYEFNVALKERSRVTRPLGEVSKLWAKESPSASYFLDKEPKRLCEGIWAAEVTWPDPDPMSPRKHDFTLEFLVLEYEAPAFVFEDHDSP